MDNLYFIFFFFFCCFLFLLFILTKQFVSQKFIKLPPSPLAIPIIGHLHLIKNELYQDLASFSSKYGPVFSLRFGCRSYVVVSSPSAIEECFVKNDVLLANRPRTMAFDRFTYNYVSYGVAPYGHLWRVVRRLAVVESLSVNRLRESSVFREEEIRVILCSLFRVSKNGFKRVDLNYWVSVYALNAVMKMVTGRSSVEEEDAGEESGKKVLEEFRGLYGAGTTLTECDFFPILRMIGYRGMEKGMIALHKKRDSFLQGLVDEFRNVKSGNFSTSKSRMKKKEEKEEKKEGEEER